LKRAGPLNSTGVGMLNHQTSKISPISFWSEISLWVFKIRGFEGGIGVFKRGESLNSTGVGFLNYQTSKISPTSFWPQISLWVFKIRGFECGIGVFKCGGSLNSTGAGMLNHQTSKISPISFGPKFQVHKLLIWYLHGHPFILQNSFLHKEKDLPWRFFNWMWCIRHFDSVIHISMCKVINK
jgi:hypothetical protein